MDRRNFAKIHWPYAIQKMNDSIGGWIILNRGYKPLGTTERCVYENIPARSRIAAITHDQQLALNNSSNGKLAKDEMIFLYSDRTSPMVQWATSAHIRNYKQRVKLLNQLKTLDGSMVDILL